MSAEIFKTREFFDRFVLLNSLHDGIFFTQIFLNNKKCGQYSEIEQYLIFILKS
jgi:hypothetical protein